MRCVICKKGETKTGKATVTLERNNKTVVFKSVPAKICKNCGEEYINEKDSARLLKSAEKVVREGVQIDVREYASV